MDPHGKDRRAPTSPRHAGIGGPEMSLHSFIFGFVLGCTVICVLGVAGVWKLVLCLDCDSMAAEVPVFLPAQAGELYRYLPHPSRTEKIVNRSFASRRTKMTGPVYSRVKAVGCPDRPLHLAVLVLSSPRGQLRRNAIRGTWQHNYRPQKLQVTVKFLVGTKNMVKERRSNLTQEEQTFHDMLLLPKLVDTYANLSTKVLMGLEWAHRNVDFDYLIKTDDDSYVRLEEVEAVLRRMECEQRLYWGYFMGHAVAETSGKWAETRWFNCPHYLPYAMGGGYVLSRGVVDHLMRYPKRLKCYSNEDMTVGSWLAPLRLVRKHDLRFNVESLSHGCSNYYLISHKERVKTFYEKHTSLARNHTLCQEEKEVRPAYIYNWEVPPLDCCIRNKGLRIPTLDDT